MEVRNKVRIKKDSPYYGTDDANPEDMIGVIIQREQGDGHAIRVQWLNGHTNSYRVKDLESVDEVNNTYQIY